jgi:hypothetical protein
MSLGFRETQDVDTRHKAGHDEAGGGQIGGGELHPIVKVERARLYGRRSTVVRNLFHLFYQVEIRISP